MTNSHKVYSDKDQNIDTNKMVHARYLCLPETKKDKKSHEYIHKIYRCIFANDKKFMSDKRYFKFKLNPSQLYTKKY